MNGSQHHNSCTVQLRQHTFPSSTCVNSITHTNVTLIFIFVFFFVCVCGSFRSFSGPQCSSTSSMCCCKSFSTKVTTFFRRKSPSPFTTWPLLTSMPFIRPSCRNSSMAATVWTAANELFSHVISSWNR